MSTTTHAFVSGISDGADATLVRPSNWNADHALALPDTDVQFQAHRMVVTGTDRYTMAGGSELRLLEQLVPFVGIYNLGSFQVLQDQFLLQYKRATLQDSCRATLQGNAEMFVFNFAPANRLILAGGPT